MAAFRKLKNKISIKTLDNIRKKAYNTITGQGNRVNERRKALHPKKGGDAVEEVVNVSDSEQIKKLLESLQALLESGSVEKITLTIKPKKPKQQ